MIGAGTRYDYPDSTEAAIVPLTEETLAQQRASRGDRIVFARGRYWVETVRGFYDAIHFLSRRRRDEIGRPAALCWGYRSALTDGSAGAANATLPVQLMTDLEKHDLSVLPKRMRRYIRSLHSHGVRIVSVDTPDVLEEQGYELMMDWRDRTGQHELTRSASTYHAMMERRVGNPAWLVLAGMDGDRLLGYITAWAVDQTAYLQDLHVRTEVLRSGISAALNYEAIQVFKRCGTVTEVTPGLHRPELPDLTAFKEKQGFAVVQVPSRVWMLPGTGAYLRRRYPVKYYRLTGRGLRHVQTSGQSDGAPPVSQDESSHLSDDAP